MTMPLELQTPPPRDDTIFKDLCRGILRRILLLHVLTPIAVIEIALCLILLTGRSKDRAMVVIVSLPVILIVLPVGLLVVSGVWESQKLSIRLFRDGTAAMGRIINVSSRSTRSGRIKTILVEFESTPGVKSAASVTVVSPQDWADVEWGQEVPLLILGENCGCYVPGVGIFSGRKSNDRIVSHTYESG